MALQLRRDTAANWTANNSLLESGQPGYETDTGKIKVGDGVTHWNSLNYIVTGAGTGTWGAINGTIGSQTDLQTELATKQATLVSGTNIKTVNSLSLLGSGDLAIQGTPQTLSANPSDLSALIATANANPTLQYSAYLTANTAIATSEVVPSNVFIEPVNGAMFTKSGSGTVEFQGPGIVGDPLVQIFSGFATNDVKWTGAYVKQFRPEWWGAKGDDSTDDLPAFQACHDSMQNTTFSTQYSGGTMWLRQGVSYFLSSTLQIIRPLLIDNGSPADYNRNVTQLRFPANTPGVVTNGESTLNGIPSSTQDGQMCEMRGVVLRGAVGSTNTILSTSGLNLTLTGGAISSVSRRGNSDNSTNPPICVSPGSTVTVNGYNYVVDPALDYLATSTVPILKPRIYVDATNGSPTLHDQEGNGFPSNNDWAGQSLEVNGTIYTISSHTTSVITLTGNFVGPAGTNLYTGTNTTGIKSQSGIASRLNIYHGLDVRIQSKFKNMRITGFAGNGVDMNTERYPSAFLGTEPNANNSWFERVSCDFNQGNGWDFFGINANNFETHSINAENNHGFGYFEFGTLGANHYSWHNAFNGQGAFSMTGFGTNNIMNCYTEGGQASALIGPGTIVFSGDIASGIDYYWGSGGYLQTAGSGGFEIQSFFQLKKWKTTYNTIPVPKSFNIRIGSNNEPSTLLAFGAGEDAVNTSLYPADNPVLSSYFLSYNEYSAGWYSIGYGTNYFTAGSNGLFAVSGSQATEGAGNLWLPKGFYAGASTARRNWQYVNAIPVSGTVGLGDVFWNSDVDLVSDPMGWIVTTAGTVGSGAVLTPFFPFSGSTGLTMGTTTSDGTSNALLKTNGSGKVANSAITDDGTNVAIGSGSNVTISPAVSLYLEAGSALQAGCTAAGLFLGNALDQFLIRVADSVISVTNSSGTAATGWMQTGGNRRLTTSPTNATNTMSNLTDLTLNVITGRKYSGTFVIYANNSTAAEGLQFDFNGGTGGTFSSVEFGFASTPPGVGLTLGTLTSTALGTPLTAATATTADAVYTIHFSGVCNGTGTLIPRFAENSAHTSGTATVKTNSFCSLDDNT